MGLTPYPFKRFNLPFMKGLDVAEQAFISWQRGEIPTLVWEGSSWTGRRLVAEAQTSAWAKLPCLFHQADETPSTFPFSTGNTSPARSRHGTCHFPNFIVLLPERCLTSPKPSLFLPCHFQARRKFGPRPPTLHHHALLRFILFSLFLPKCGNSSCTIFWFLHLWGELEET